MEKTASREDVFAIADLRLLDQTELNSERAMRLAHSSKMKPLSSGVVSESETFDPGGRNVHEKDGPVTKTDNDKEEEKGKTRIYLEISTEDVPDDLDDIGLKKGLKLEQRLDVEESSELVLNPPEQVPSTYKLDVIKVETIPSTEPEERKKDENFVNAYICIWDAKYSRGRVGHAALLCLVDYLYISWFPGNLMKKIVWKPPGVAKVAIEEDFVDGGQMPDHVFRYRTNKIKEIREQWQEDQKNAYHLTSNNCCNKVYKALRSAGAPEYIPPREILTLFLYYFDIWRPQEFLRYCRRNFKRLK